MSAKDDRTVRIATARPLPQAVDQLVKFALVMAVCVLACLALLGIYSAWQTFVGFRETQPASLVHTPATSAPAPQAQEAPVSQPPVSPPPPVQPASGLQLQPPPPAQLQPAPLSQVQAIPAPQLQPAPPAAPVPTQSVATPLPENSQLAAAVPVLHQPIPFQRSRDMNEAINRLRCGWARIRTIGKTSVLEGVVAEETVADLLLARDDLPVAKQPDLKLQLFSQDPVYCQALEMVNRIQRLAVPAAAKFSVRLQTKSGMSTVEPDQLIQLQVTPPEMVGFVSADLLTRTSDQASAGRAVVQHLIPRIDPNYPRANHRAMLRGSSYNDFSIPDENRSDFSGWPASLPDGADAGADLIIVTWTSKPLSIATTTDDEFDVEAYLARMDAALGRAEPGDVFAVTAVLIPIVRQR